MYAFKVGLNGACHSLLHPHSQFEQRSKRGVCVGGVWTAGDADGDDTELMMIIA